MIVGADNLTQVLGIKTGRQRRRADQIAKHHSQLPPLCLDCGVRTGRSRHVLRRGPPGTCRKISDRFQQQPAMADRGEAKFFQIIGRQLRQDAQVDLVLAESLLVCSSPSPRSQPAMSIVSFRRSSSAHSRRETYRVGAYDLRTGISSKCVILRALNKDSR